jgi:AcrR family transcriptional regulator
MNFSEFQHLMNVSRHDFCREVFDQNRENIRVKKEKIVIKNLDKIFTATLKISNKRGFQTMSMRDLSLETGLSLGALYAYFASKDELLEMLQQQGRMITSRVLNKGVKNETHPLSKLKAFVKTYLYLCEAMHSWFYFSYMEARNLSKAEREKALSSDLMVEEKLISVLEQGEQQGIFKPLNHNLTAGVINAMIQDWYLKRWKHTKMNISVDQYADFILEFIESRYISLKQ